MKQYWLKFHASGQRWIRVEPLGMVQPITHNLVETETRYHMVWFSQSQWLCSKWRIKVAAHTKSHSLAIIFANSDGIWSNYVDLQQKIMQVGFIILLCTWGYNSLVDWSGSTMFEGKLVRPKANWWLVEIVENSFRQNPLQCGYFYNTQFNYWFGPLGNNIFLVFEHFVNLNLCIFNKNTLKWCVWSTRNASWVISNMAASTKFNSLCLPMPLIWRNMK